MEGRTLYLVGAGAAAGVLAWWFWGDPEADGLVGDLRQVFTDAVNAVTQGRRLTRCPYDKATGIAPCDPDDLAAAAGLDLDTYALARAIASEEGNSSPGVQALVAHAMVNHARLAGKSISAVLLYAKNPDHRGFFGTQKDLETTLDNGKHPSDRYASTASDPYEGHAAVAAGVLSDAIPDLTGGADQFDRTDSDDNPEKVAANRIAGGSELVTGLDDLGLGDLRFWRKVSA
jgi:hypothetical protein